jgi:hypothetical protein
MGRRWRAARRRRLGRGGRGLSCWFGRWRGFARPFGPRRGFSRAFRRRRGIVHRRLRLAAGGRYHRGRGRQSGCRLGAAPHDLVVDGQVPLAEQRPHHVAPAPSACGEAIAGVPYPRRDRIVCAQATEDRRYARHESSSLAVSLARVGDGWGVKSRATAQKIDGVSSRGRGAGPGRSARHRSIMRSMKATRNVVSGS